MCEEELEPLLTVEWRGESTLDRFWWDHEVVETGTEGLRLLWEEVPLKLGLVQPTSLNVKASPVPREGREGTYKYICTLEVG